MSKIMRKFFQSLGTLFRREPRKISQMFSAQATGTPSVSAEKILGTTGRRGYALINNQPTQYGEVQNLVNDLCSTRDQVSWSDLTLNQPVAKVIDAQVSQAAIIGIDTVYFRSRAFALADVPTSADFGPPPMKQSVGRYNEAHDRVLYLARTEETAVCEIEATRDKPRVWVQRFNLVLPRTK